MTQPAAIVDPAPAPTRPFALPLPGVWVWLACVSVALACNWAGLFGPDFIGSDQRLVRDNDLLNRLPGLQTIWFITDADTYALPQYSPLTQTTFFIDRIFYGARPAGYRITSMLLHATCGLMLWQLLRRLRVRGAIAVALLFVAHPMSVESVCWLTERRNPLAALLGLSSVYLLLRGAGVIPAPAGTFKPLPDEPSRLYAMGVVLFVLGLFASPSIAPLPLAMLLVLWARRVKPDVRLTSAAVGLMVAGIAMLAWTSTVEKARAGVASPAAWNRAETSAGELAVRAQVAGRAVAFYAGKLAVPFPLSVDYPRWQTPRDVESFRQHTPDAGRAARWHADVAPGDLLAYAYPLGVAAILLAAWLLRSRLGRLPFALAAAFVLLLAPSLGFTDLGWMRYSFVADRAAYLAAIPFLVGVVLLADRLFVYAADRTVNVASAVIITALFVILSARVAYRYHNERDFWRRTANAITTRGANGPVADPRSWLPRYELARAILDYNGGAEIDAYDALAQVQRIRPDEPSPLVLQGEFDALAGNEGVAMAKFERSMQEFPGYAPAFYAAAQLFSRQADARPTDPKPRSLALQGYHAAAERDPLDARSRVRLGQTLFEVARRLQPEDKQIPDLVDAAAKAFDEAVQLRPYDVDLLLDVARTLVAMGKLSDASGLLRTAQTLAPRRADVYLLIADAALFARNLQGGEAALQTALLNDPHNVKAYLNLGSLRQAQERWDEARDLLGKALENDPKNEEAARRLTEVEARAATRPTR